MRASLIVAATAVGLMSSAAAAQQSPLDGPLAAPGDVVTKVAPSQAKPHAKAKSRKPHHAKAAVPARDEAATQPAPGDPPAAPPHAAPPADAFDLGMKWNGNNDGAAQTKFQSGPDTSSGTGAEVGMKLHF